MYVLGWDLEVTRVLGPCVYAINKDTLSSSQYKRRKLWLKQRNSRAASNQQQAMILNDHHIQTSSKQRSKTRHEHWRPQWSFLRKFHELAKFLERKSSAKVYLRSCLSAFSKLTNCGARNMKSLICFVFQLLEKNRNWKCSNFDNTTLKSGP